MENTSIEYATHTFSPWIGCDNGCPYCYAARWAERFPRYRNCFTSPHVFVRTSPATWNKLQKWDTVAKAQNTRFRILPSLCDVFSAGVRSVQTDFFELTSRTPNLIYLLLTKCPSLIDMILQRCESEFLLNQENIWFGTSIEDQKAADFRIPPLLRVSSPRRFLSLEPLLGPVNLKPYLHGIHWVIAGGQTGPEAQPLHPAWIRSIRDQCKRAGVPFFFKQWGEWWSSNQSECRAFLLFHPQKDKIPARHFFESPMYEGQTFYRVGKKHSGRTLDRKLHLDMPPEIT